MKLSEVIDQYISHKRLLGYRFKTEEAVLKSFSKKTKNESIIEISPEQVLYFLNNTVQITGYWIKKYNVLSGFYRFALLRGLIEMSPLPRGTPKLTAPVFIPYIYTHDELKRLIQAIPAACTKKTPIEKDTMKTLILLLYGTGLRMGEALKLTLDDVDMDKAYLHIRETKFFKNRLVPLCQDLIKLLTEYMTQKHKQDVNKEKTTLFCFRDKSPLSQSAVRSVFRRLRVNANIIRTDNVYYQPRIHDLRHTAAVHRLIAWYRSGADLQNFLPKLSIYLGHGNLSSTQRYLTMTLELLNEASIKFENYFMGEHHDN